MKNILKSRLLSRIVMLFSFIVSINLLCSAPAIAAETYDIDASAGADFGISQIMFEAPYSQGSGLSMPSSDVVSYDASKLDGISAPPINMLYWCWASSAKTSCDDYYYNSQYCSPFKIGLIIPAGVEVETINLVIADTCSTTLDYAYLTYDGNGATGGTAPKSPTYITSLQSSSFELPANTYTKTGYTFAGWTIGGMKLYGSNCATSNCWSVLDFLFDGTHTGSTQTIKPNWTPNTYTVTFNANGGSGTMANQTFTYDSSAALTKNAFTKTNYEFLGWSTNKDATTATYSNQQSVKNLAASGSVTLYAIWKYTVYSATFAMNSGGGSGTTPTGVTCTSESCKLPENPYTKTGYTFAGWEVTDDCNVFGGYVGQPGEELKSGINSCIGSMGQVVLVALWEANKYTVVFNANGGTGTMANQSRQYND
ncbi:MAG: InlB B-repeat-containing protein, partial [Alphaproteobacteria bacterium]|nr:InlB B-repeat-containing protein [Alphaproteobacteria bacterium]